MSATKKTPAKKAPTTPKTKAPEEAYGTTFYATFGSTNGPETNGRPEHVYGVRSPKFRGKAIVIVNPSKGRLGGKGKRLLDYIRNGETYEELQTRLATDRKNGTAPIFETNIGHHLDWDLDKGATKLVAYYDSKENRIRTPVPEELKKAREGSELPPLDS